MLSVFLKILSIFCMVGIGFIASKKNVLPMESNKYLVNLILVITNPCLILSSMGSQTLSDDIIRQTWEILAGSVVFFLLSSAVAFFIVKAMRYNPAEDQGVMMVIITAINSGFMGFPVTKSIFGDHFFFLMVIENVILNIYLFSLSVVQMNYGHQKSRSLKEVFRPLLNMCTFSVVIGLVIMITGFKISGQLFDFLDTIANATVPVSMIVVGIQLANSDLLKMMKNTRLIIACLCNVVVIPALTFLAVNWLPLMNESKLILIFAAAFPCAVITVAISSKEGRNSALMAEGVAMSTLFSLATLPVVAMGLMALYL